MDLSRPAVSVVIPAFNRGDLLEQALQSVLAQTYLDYEIIVVDDGSDCVLQDAVKCDDPRVRFIRQPNAGRSSARNSGIRESSGRYIAFLDSDDIWYPTKLERQVATLEGRPDVCMVYGDYDLLISGKLRRHRRTFPDPGPNFVARLLHSNVITGSASSAMVRKDALDAVGVFDETLSAFEDLDLWRRLAGYRKFFRLRESIVAIRIHEHQSQKDSGFVQQNAKRYVAKLVNNVAPGWHLNRAVSVIIDSSFFGPALREKKKCLIGEGFGLAKDISILAVLLLSVRLVVRVFYWLLVGRWMDKANSGKVDD